LAYRFVVESDGDAPLTPEQVRAARQLLGWSRTRLAARIGVTHTAAIARYEDGKGQSRFLDLAVVRTVLESAGIIFGNEHAEDPDVRLRKSTK
jgi:ribosome-binding protein aMBF1 (putative translation factor)